MPIRLPFCEQALKSEPLWCTGSVFSCCAIRLFRARCGAADFHKYPAVTLRVPNVVPVDRLHAKSRHLKSC